MPGLIFCQLGSLCQYRRDSRSSGVIGSGLHVKDGSVVNMGESVLESLHSNTSVKWIFPDTEEEAKEGVEAGKYYAAIVITDKFTYSMYNAFSDDFENPALIYYQNQKSNAIATKITDTVAGTLQNTINETFIKVAATTILKRAIPYRRRCRVAVTWMNSVRISQNLTTI